MKKLFTFLGTGRYEKVFYSYDEQKTDTKFVQEAICNIIGNDVQVIACLTEKSKEKNWNELETILSKNKMNYKVIDILDGNNDNEIWNNFNLLYEELEENDEIYLDITYSFRSIPVIIISVLNYAKFIKNIKIKGIYYGAYEAKKDELVPIFNLSLFDKLTDWTVGAERFINTGDSTLLCERINNVTEPILKKTTGKDEEAKISKKIKNNLESFSGALHTVRGKDVSKYGMALKNSLENIKEIHRNELNPFEKILDKIYEKAYFYSGDVVKDIHYTIKLCGDLNLIQQGYTLFRENIINYVCVCKGLDTNNKECRDSAEKYLAKGRNDSNESYNNSKEMAERFLTKLRKLFNDIGSNYRNDLNHAGYRQDAKDYKKFKERLNEFILEFEPFVLDEEYKKIVCKEILEDSQHIECDTLLKNMILIFSHKLTDKQIQDAKVNLNIDEFIYLPQDLQNKWSLIDPDLENVSSITCEIKKWIDIVVNTNDYILVQGDFGATYDIVNYCKNKELKAIYSTTKRVAKETVIDGGKIELIHVFEHVRYREY